MVLVVEMVVIVKQASVRNEQPNGQIIKILNASRRSCCVVKHTEGTANIQNREVKIYTVIWRSSSTEALSGEMAQSAWLRP